MNRIPCISRIQRCVRGKNRVYPIQSRYCWAWIKSIFQDETQIQKMLKVLGDIKTEKVESINFGPCYKAELSPNSNFLFYHERMTIVDGSVQVGPSEEELIEILNLTRITADTKGMVLDEQEMLPEESGLAKAYFANFMGEESKPVLTNETTEKVLPSFSPAVNGCVFFRDSKAISLDYEYDTTQHLNQDIKLLTELFLNLKASE